MKNRTIANSNENKTPFETFFGNKPNVKNLKIYGSKVFVRKPEALRKGKWDDKAQLGILVGYTHNGYRVLLNNKVINARHVQIVEDGTEIICLEKVNDENIIELNLDESNDSSSETSSIIENDFDDRNLINNNNEIENENENINNVFNRSNENLNVTRTSNRKKSPVRRYGNPVAHYIYIHYVNANVPNTFEEALNSSEFIEWQRAMNSEIECLKKNNTWVVVDKPKIKRLLI